MEPGRQPARLRATRASLLYAAASFLSAALLFLVQPLAGKSLLPRFGGSPATWIACMLFFQLGLLGGYLYAHLVSSALRPPWQRRIHALTLVAACASLPIDATSDADALLAPEWAILGGLGRGLGLPYLALSASAPLLQRWYSEASSGRSPYRLYAAGNAGSLVGLLAFPFALEPLVGMRTLGLLCSGGLVLAAILLLACASVKTDRPDPARAGAEDAAAPDLRSPWEDRLLWWVLPFTGSVCLLAVTRHLGEDIAAVPLLWVLPLALYLLTYVLAFNSPRWYSRSLCLVLLGAATLALTVLRASKIGIAPSLLIGIHGAVVFLCCMVCHGELARTRPHPAHLTAFYVGCAGGGALGGTFVSLLAPRLFDTYVELPLAVELALLLALVGALRERNWMAGKVRLGMAVVLPGLVLALSLAAWLAAGGAPDPALIAQDRNFFGVTRVVRHDHGGEDRHLVLYHGSTIHGMQNLSPSARTRPTSYYGPESGVGLILSADCPPGRIGGRRIGVIGLGAGTLASYGRAGDTMRFYELDPNMIEVARRHFDFLRASAAVIEVLPGDARISLAREAPQDYDVLVLDAFSSDAIPVHLLTLEAFRLYRRHLRPDGVLVVHISNRYLDLGPVVWRIAEELNLGKVLVRAPSDHQTLVSASVYVLLSPSPDVLAVEPILGRDQGSTVGARRVALWTDDYSNLLAALD